MELNEYSLYSDQQASSQLYSASRDLTEDRGINLEYERSTTAQL